MPVSFDVNNMEEWRKYFLPLKELCEQGILMNLADFYNNKLSNKTFEYVVSKYPALLFPEKPVGTATKRENFLMTLFGRAEKIINPPTTFEALISFINGNRGIPKATFGYFQGYYLLSILKVNARNVLRGKQLEPESRSLDLSISTSDDLRNIRDKLAKEIAILLNYFPAYNERALFLFSLSGNVDLKFILAQYPDLSPETIKDLGYFTQENNKFGITTVTDFGGYQNFVDGLMGISAIGNIIGIEKFPNLGKEMAEFYRDGMNQFPPASQEIIRKSLEQIKSYSSDYGLKKLSDLMALSREIGVFYSELITNLMPYFFIGALRIDGSYENIKGFENWL